MSTTVMPYDTSISINQLPESILLKTFDYLDNETLWNLINTSKSIQNIIGGSKKCMEKQLLLTPEKIAKIVPGGQCDNIPFRNVEANGHLAVNTLKQLSSVLRNAKRSIEVLQLKDFRRNSFSDTLEFFTGFGNLRKLALVKCETGASAGEGMPQLDSLNELFFERCDANFYSVFQNQKNITKITVRNTDWTWNGFAHDNFNALMTTLPNCKHVCFEGIGTGSYFDMDEFPYRLKTLETTTISFHWYVGIRTARKQFMETQKGFLQQLIIHKLPYDFDGGDLLKFLIEQMNLDKFYYGDIPLILNGQKQNVEEFTATEIQLTALFQMFAQFPTIKKLKLVLNQTDVDSSAIESVINPPTDLFRNARVLEVVDESRYRGLLGVFLGLFKNFRNIQILKINTSDRNLNVLLEEFLPTMTNLEEFYLKSFGPLAQSVPASSRVDAAVRNCAPNLKKFIYFH